MRVLIVDDSPEIRSLLRSLVEGLECEVIGEAADGRDGVEAAGKLRPDLILLDVSMPVMGGFPAANLLSSQMPELPIIFVSQHAGRQYVEQAFQRGAKGYILKQAVLKELPAAVEAVREGHVFCSPLIA